MGRIVIDRLVCACGNDISKTNKTGRCVPCSIEYRRACWTRGCVTPGCDNKIADNNVTGVCGECRDGKSEAIKVIRAVRARFCDRCGRKLSNNNQDDYCGKCRDTLGIRVMHKVTVTDQVATCWECKREFYLQSDQHPRHTRWCPACRPVVMDDAKGQEWVGLGEIGA